MICSRGLQTYLRMCVRSTKHVGKLVGPIELDDLRSSVEKLAEPGTWS